MKNYRSFRLDLKDYYINKTPKFELVHAPFTRWPERLSALLTRGHSAVSLLKHARLAGEWGRVRGRPLVAAGRKQPGVGGIAGVSL